MKKIVQWILGLSGALLLLGVAAVIIVPQVVDIKQYKPRLEKMVADATGRPFSVGGDIHLSLFPWVGVSMADVHLGNPPEGGGGEFISIRSFKAKVKLLPLLSRDVQVREFVVDGPRIVLVKDKNGKGNWVMSAQSSDQDLSSSSDSGAEPSADSAGQPGGLPIAALQVDRFAVTSGSVEWHDMATNDRHSVSGMALELTDLSFDAPIALRFSARVDDHPLALTGSLGPVGNPPAGEKLPLDLSVTLADEIVLGLKGEITRATTDPAFALHVNLAPFSPRKVLGKLGAWNLPQAGPSGILEKFSLSATVSGTPSALTLADGKMVLDDSTLVCSAGIRSFEKPDIRFQLDLDTFDLDRYLPLAAATETGGEVPAGGGTAAAKADGAVAGKEAPAPAPVDYTFLRRLVLDGRIGIQHLKAHGMTFDHVAIPIAARGGKISISPLTLDLYQGKLNANTHLDVGKKSPVGNLSLTTRSVQVGPLLMDATQKSFLEGALDADVAVNFTGDTPDAIKSGLNGKGTLLFTDGAIVGVDFAGMVRNVTAKLGMTEETETRPRTDFAELKVPFTLTRGVLEAQGIALASPLIRLGAGGKADLVQETLDFKVAPKFVATLKGQGDTGEHTGLTVPVRVTGTFDTPKFRPDMEEILNTSAPQVQEIGKKIQSLAEDKEKQKEALKTLEDGAKNLLKKFSFGQ